MSLNMNLSEETKRELRESAQLDLLEQSNLPKVYWDEVKLSIPEADAEAYKRLNEIKNNIIELSRPSLDIKNLLICSDKVGNGKTSWAIKILQYFLFKSAQELYYQGKENAYGCFIPVVNFVSLSREYNESRRQKYYDMMDMIENARVVVFDDIASMEYSRAELMALYEAIDGRLLRKQFCIFTTNFEDKYDKILLERLGVRLADRIYCTSEVIILNGDGVRH